MLMPATKKLAFWLYNLTWSMLIPFLRFNYRLAEGYDQRTLADFPLNDADLWIQAASAGEAYLAGELLKTINPGRPLQIQLTSNTSQGLEILSQAAEKCNATGNGVRADVAYFPFDQPTKMERAVRRIQPKVMVLLEAELWPGLLRALHAYDCKILIINGRITARSLKRYLLWPALWQSLRPDRILAISATDANRFSKLFGNHGVDVMPNIKFDRISLFESDGPIDNPIARLLPPASPFVVLGSVRQAEEALIEKIIGHIFDHRSDTVFGLFPRHMHRIAKWEQRLSHLRIPFSLRSKTTAQINPGTVVLGNTFGELTRAYDISRAAFVGGSLAPLGGQNFLEALTCGVVPVIGPSWENFAWVGREIVKQGLLRVAGDWQEVANFLLDDISHPASRQEVHHKILAYVKNRQGGTKMACDLISDLL